MGQREDMPSIWRQTNFSVWLSRRRREKLRAVAATLPPGATPVDAIDRALDLATMPIFVPKADGGAGIDDDIGEADVAVAIRQLEARLAASAAQGQTEFVEKFGNVEAKLREIGARVAHMHSMMSEATQEPIDSTEGFGMFPSSAPSLGEWLRTQAAVMGKSARETALIRAEWRSKTRGDDGKVSMEFSCELAAIDGLRAKNPPRPSLASIGSIDANGAPSKLDAAPALCFLCRALPGGRWQFDAHPIDAAGKLGAILCSFAA